jgi:ABC-type amino acid transport substrate-binding protein
MITSYKYIPFILFIGIFFQANAADVTVGLGDQNRDAIRLENGRLVGSLAKIYQCTLDKSGLSYDISVLPQARVLHLLERGELSLGLPLVEVLSRNEFAQFTHPMLDVPFVLYTRKEINVSDDLSAYTFTVLRSSASMDLVVERNAQFKEVTSWTQALALARLGRFDGAVIPVPVLGRLEAENFAGLNQLDFGSIPVSIYVSRQINNTDELVRRLNAAIDACVP